MSASAFCKCGRLVLPISRLFHRARHARSAPQAPSSGTLSSYRRMHAAQVTPTIDNPCSALDFSRRFPLPAAAVSTRGTHLPCCMLCSTAGALLSIASYPGAYRQVCTHACPRSGRRISYHASDAGQIDQSPAPLPLPRRPKQSGMQPEQRRRPPARP